MGDCNTDAGLCPFCVAPEGANFFDPAWRTSTAVALACGIVADAAFDRMPILADALQDAGCDNEAVLTHCRVATAHVPVCWVLALILAPVPNALPAPVPLPEPTAGAGRRWLDRNEDTIGRTLIGFPLVLGAAMLVVSFGLMLKAISHDKRPPPVMAPKVDLFNSPFGPKPEEKIPILRLKLKKLREAPNADPQEVKQTEEAIKFWVGVVEDRKRQSAPP